MNQNENIENIKPEAPFFERDFELWLQKLEQALLAVAKWKELLIYRNINAFDASYIFIYYGFLNALKNSYSQFSCSVLESKNKKYNYIKRFASVWKRKEHLPTIFLEAVKKNLHDLFMALPPQKMPAMKNVNRALVVRAYRNPTAFGVLEHLKEKLDWDLLFASWNVSLGKSLRALGISYINIEHIYRRKYKSILKQHRKEVDLLLSKVDISIPLNMLSAFSGIRLRFDAKPLLYRICTTVRVYTDIYFDLLQNLNPEVVILFNEVSPPGRTMAKVAEICDIPSISIQHGLFIGNVYRSLSTNKVIVWGKIPQKFWFERGCTPEQVISVGAIGHEQWHSKESIFSKRDRQTKHTVFVVGQNPGMFISQKLHKFGIEAIVYAAKKLPEIKFVIKPHPSEDSSIYKQEIKKSAIMNIQLLTTGKIEELLNDSDIVVTIFSTVGVEAMLLGIPVIVLNLSHEPSLAPFADVSSLVTDYKKLPEEILRILGNKSYKEDLVKKGVQFAHDYFGIMDGQSESRAANEIINFAQTYRNRKKNGNKKSR